MRITPKIVGGVAGLMLAGSLLAAAPAGATTYSDDCSEPVGGGLSLGWI